MAKVFIKKTPLLATHKVACLSPVAKWSSSRSLASPLLQKKLWYGTSSLDLLAGKSENRLRPSQGRAHESSFHGEKVTHSSCRHVAHLALPPAGNVRRCRTPRASPSEVTVAVPEGMTEGVTIRQVRSTLPQEVFEINELRSYSAALLTACAVGAGMWMIAASPWYLLPLVYAYTSAAWLALFVIGHDCAHKCFSKNRFMEDLVGTLALGFLMYPYEAWRFKHDRYHAKRNTLVEDTAWRGPHLGEIITLDWDPSPAELRLMLATFPLGPPLASIRHWLLWHFDLKTFTPGQQNRVKISVAAVSAFVLIAWPLTIASAGVMGWVKFWLLPWLGFHWWMSTFSAPRIPLEDVGKWDGFAKLQGTAHSESPTWFEFLCHDIHVHNPHHISQKIPWYNLRKAKESLQANWGQASQATSSENKLYGTSFSLGEEQIRQAPDTRPLVEPPGSVTASRLPPKTFSEKALLAPADNTAAVPPDTKGKVVLYDSRGSSAEHTRLTLQSPLEAGLSIVLYYPLDDDALALQESVRASLQDILEPSSYEIEHATSASSVVYLYILRQFDNCNINRLMDAIKQKSSCNPTITISKGSETWVLTRQSRGPRQFWSLGPVNLPDLGTFLGGSLTLSKIRNPPTIDLVFYYSSVELQWQHNESEFLVAHGSNLFRHGDLELKWRSKGQLSGVNLIHGEELKEAGVSYLIEEPESVAMSLPMSSGNIVYLECWRGVGYIGRRVTINPAEYSFLGPLKTDPRKWTCDVFISHTGSEKDLANQLDRAVRQIGLRPFFDLNNLKGTMGNDAIMDAAAIAAPVGVLLLSPAFFERKWPLRELANIVRSETHLPVWIGSNFGELEANLKKRPVNANLSDAEWDALVDTLKYSTTIVRGTQFTNTLLDTIMHRIVKRCHDLCKELGNQDVYNSMQLQRFRDRVLKATDAIVDCKLDSLPAEDIKRAKEWQESLRALNEDL